MFFFTLVITLPIALSFISPYKGRETNPPIEARLRVRVSSGMGSNVRV